MNDSLLKRDIVLTFTVNHLYMYLACDKGGLEQVVLVQVPCSFSTKKSAQEKSVPEKSVVF